MNKFKQGDRVKIPTKKTHGRLYSLKDFLNLCTDTTVLKVKEAYDYGEVVIDLAGKIFSFDHNDLELWEDTPTYKGIHIKSKYPGLISAFSDNIKSYYYANADTETFAGVFWPKFNGTNAIKPSEGKEFNLPEQFEEAVNYAKEFLTSLKPKEKNYAIRNDFHVTIRKGEVEWSGKTFPIQDLEKIWDYYSNIHTLLPGKIPSRYDVKLTDYIIKVGCQSFTLAQFTALLREHNQFIASIK